jgi:hypothetical protein
MKILSKLFLVLFGLLLLSGCDSFRGIRADFEDAGYTYSETVKGYVDELLAEFEEEDVIVTPHVFTKNLNIAIVLEFRSTKELEAHFAESETLQGILADLEKADCIRGNCLLLPLGLNPQEMIDIFQGK